MGHEISSNRLRFEDILRQMSGGVTVMAWVLLGLLYVAFYLLVRRKEVRAAWARRAEEDEWSWKLLIPRPERPWLAWASFGTFGLLAVLSFSQGRRGSGSQHRSVLDQPRAGDLVTAADGHLGPRFATPFGSFRTALNTVVCTVPVLRAALARRQAGRNVSGRLD